MRLASRTGLKSTEPLPCSQVAGTPDRIGQRLSGPVVSRHEEKGWLIAEAALGIAGGPIRDMWAESHTFVADQLRLGQGP